MSLTMTSEVLVIFSDATPAMALEQLAQRRHWPVYHLDRPSLVEVVQQTRLLKPEVVVVELSRTDAAMLAMIRHLREPWFRVHVLACGCDFDPRTEQAVRAAGVRAVIRLPSTGDTHALETAIDQLLINGAACGAEMYPRTATAPRPRMKQAYPAGAALP